MQIAVVGAGWYGCHIAAVLTSLGIEVDLYEKNERIFGEASGNNQFRLHMGFHYARSHRTRLQSRDGYARFLERYSDLSRPIEDNIYGVPTNESLIDFTTYKIIMSSAGIEYREGDVAGLERLGFRHLDGFLYAPERVVMTSFARSYFEQRLAKQLKLGTPASSIVEHASHVAVNGHRYDFLVDTTWGHLSPLPIACYWEPTLLLYYRSHVVEPALTLVDGPLASVYPTEEDRLYTLSSVPITPLGRFDSPEEAVNVRDGVTREVVERKREQMEAQIERHIVNFKDRFAFEGIQLAVKTKPIGASDDRSCWVGHAGRSFTVLSGKIDTIFFAAETIVAQLEAMVERFSDTTAGAKPSVAGIRPMPCAA